MFVIVAEQRLVGGQRGEKDGDLGQCRRIRREAFAQRRQVGQLACREVGSQQCGEFGLAAALMRQRQQVDHQTAGRLFRDPFEQPVEGLPVGVAREELVTVDEAQQRHRFAPQGVDHVAIIDDMRVLAGGIGPSTDQGHQRRAADEQIEAVVIQPDPQAVADQPRWHGVEHLLQHEAAGGGDGDDGLLMIAGPLPGQTAGARAARPRCAWRSGRSCG